LIACPSYATAIVILPPQHLHNDLNILRSVYDKSHPRWSPHITIAIPFVPPSELPQAVNILSDLFNGTDLLKPWTITFEKTGSFTHKDSATVYLKPDEESERRFRAIRERLEGVFSLQGSEDGVFRPHLTIGQTSLESVEKLQEKAEMLVPISWTFESLVVINKNESEGGRMEVFATIPESNNTIVPSASSQAVSPCCYSYNEFTERYEVYQSTSLFDIITPPTSFTISTYNILHSPFQPQTVNSPRLPLLLNIILQQPSTILILQEVTDISWKYFLSNPLFRQKFQYLSFPSHLPLPNHRNILILSTTIPFKASYLPLVSPHKPALIADFATFLVAGVHLTSGLHEEKLSLKHKELSKLTAHLQLTNRPVLLAGDFNIPKQGREYTAALPKFLDVLEQYEDSWPEGDDTFCPGENKFAFEGARSLVSQRYDRVVFTKGVFNVEKRWVFGRPKQQQDEEELASDHWGVSVTLNTYNDTSPVMDTFSHGTNIETREILELPKTKWTDDEITNTLHIANIIPNSNHDHNIHESISLLQSVLNPLKTQIPFLLQPLGSFTLGAHTLSSDLDILAVSTISPKTFWTLFLQHLYRYKISPLQQGDRIKLLRVIKDAKTPMVELLIDGIAFEVLYCAAGRLLPMYIYAPFSLQFSSDKSPFLCLYFSSPILVLFLLLFGR
jgi:2'-5' RNA ligase